MIWRIFVLGSFLLLTACSKYVPVNEPVSDDKVPVEIVLFDWEDDIPQEVLDDFLEETGIVVDYIGYDSEQEAEINLFYRNSDFDVIVVDNDSIPLLTKNHLLAEMNYELIPNYKYISINFRDLVYDPENKYSIPFNWGTTGIIYRKGDMINPPQAWADLWQYSDSIKIGLKREMAFDNLAFAKKMLGVSINDCDPQKMQNVADQFLLLEDNVVWLETDAKHSIDELQNGNVDMVIGWSDDVLEAEERGLEVVYVLPEEGTVLWGDSFVISARSKHHDEAAQFINYLIDPEVSAKIIEYNNYASANDSVQEFLPADLVNSPIIFPDNDSMRHAEIYLPVSDECNALHLQTWKNILNAIE
jgi:spermidine/putrescine transport system substrate-binding protein